MTKRILFVDDEPVFHELLCKRLRKITGVEVVSAFSAHDAVKLYNQMIDFDLIILDGYLHEERDTLFLARFLRKVGYAGPMVAASADAAMRKKQLEVGCDHEAPSKMELANVVCDILGLS